MSEYSTLSFTQQDGVATITLNRPDSANSINLLMSQELLHAANACDTNSEIRAVLLTGSGSMFSAGGDVASFAAAGDGIALLAREITQNLHAANATFARMDAPLVIAVNGTAAGAGFSLVASGDIVLASEKAKFTMAYTGIGASPDGSASYYLPRLIGLRKTQELMLTNRLLSAEEALDWGILTQVTSPESLMEEAEKVAARLAKGPTKAFGTVKSLLLQSFDNSLESQLELESRGIADNLKTADGIEGVAAFMEKRKPTFSGQ